MIVENKYFKVVVNKVSGGISSIIDKRSRKEIINPGKFYANELIAFEVTGSGESLGPYATDRLTGKKWLMRDI